MTLNGDKLDYTPPPGFTGTDTFTYTISDGDEDGHGHRDHHGAQQPAGGSADSRTTPTTPTGRRRVLGNDNDPDSDPLTVTLVTTPKNGGTVVIDDSGKQVSYTPKDGFVGTDTFEYTISDGRGGQSKTQVTITIENAPPVADNDEAGTGPAKAVTIDVLDNDSDANQIRSRSRRSRPPRRAAAR